MRSYIYIYIFGSVRFTPSSVVDLVPFRHKQLCVGNITAFSTSLLGLATANVLVSENTVGGFIGPGYITKAPSSTSVILFPQRHRLFYFHLSFKSPP